MLFNDCAGDDVDFESGGGLVVGFVFVLGEEMEQILFG